MTELTEICRFNAHLYLAAKTFAADNDDPRYYLNGVCIEPSPAGGCLLIATDGHRLVCLHDVAGTAVADFKHHIIIPKLRLCYVRLKNSWLPRIARVLTSLDTFPDATIEILTDDGQVIASQYATLIEGQFPQWRAVVPAKVEQSELESAAFNPDYLKQFRAVARGYAQNPNSLYVVHPRGENVALVTWEKLPAVASIMPLKNKGAVPVRPEFADGASVGD
jgi:hypothetical protein